MIGEPKDFLTKRAEQIGFDRFRFQEFPVIFWDLFGEKGHPYAPPCPKWGHCCSPG
jgi:hypothetical protein